jgi:hypothetical protein
VRKAKPKTFVSPFPHVFGPGHEPEALKREIAVNGQKDWAEDTIIYGEDNALPLRIAHAVDESPAASSCIDTIAQFIKGSSFSNLELMNVIIDEYGTTLWDFHCGLADSCALLWGFAVNLKYNLKGRITNAYQMSFESCRFVKPCEDTPIINKIKYNPYFGTVEYKKEYTKEYPVYDQKQVLNQIQTWEKFPGQVYYYGKTSPLHRFYPVPRYWSGKKWIYIDGRIQEAHAENMDNGWFQSVLMNVIGDPNEPSRNPKYREEYTDENGEKRIRYTKTVGEEFNEQMSSAFSGSKKMGTVQVHWSLNDNNATKVTAFPSNANADLFLALQDITTKNITIATKVPSILANISDGVSLGSDGNEMQKAVELMQSRVVEWQQKLMSFYNNVLLPNLVQPVLEKVEIVHFNPISEAVEIDDKFWEVLTPEEKRSFIKKHFPGVIAEQPATQQPIEGEEAAQEGVEINDNLKNMTGKQQQQFLRIIRQFSQGKINQDQASILLKGSFGFTDEEVLKVLGINDTEE